ncbi:PUB domain protein (macronuclear) [Tetrahymena thermophila SB210]|uniref:PUB domain protein n=1 Tax=Tetrahymena thermophila (strain SB210) TaxID=312017 RepID=Q22UW3_TETTS|nr:PUB domain protein [Tetrahymena thermophila SB210]EAR89185.1 PUB domain protein [Tetrahymena thermophila SB210]|eukprot:XP_001009430.1 PUB domain protein [Tetrahymena thermophila SB210]
MGQCCSAKSKKSRKNKYIQEEVYNILQDRQALDFYKDFIVFTINPSSGYTFLQKQIIQQTKDQNIREYEFLKVDTENKSIAGAQAIKPFTSNEAEDKMLQILFNFKEVIIHNNGSLQFDYNDVTHPINKLLANFRQKNVKPKVINILTDNSIFNKFEFISDQNKCLAFASPVLVIDSYDIVYKQKIISKSTWHGSNLYIHSKKSYEQNSNKYEEYLQISTFIHLYKNPAAGVENNNINQLYFDISNQDQKKQQKIISQIRESIVNSFQRGFNAIIIHENNDKKSISQILILIMEMLLYRLSVQEQEIVSYWERRIPKGIFDSFKQDLAEQSQAKKQQQELENVNDNQEQNNIISNEEANAKEQSNSNKIEILIQNLFKEQSYDLKEFEKSQNILEKLLQNITSQFDKKEFRSLNKSNQNLQCLFKYQNGVQLLNSLGFIESPDKNGFLNNPIDDIAYFKLIKSDYTIAYKNFQQSKIYIEQQKLYYKQAEKAQNGQKTS